MGVFVPWLCIGLDQPRYSFCLLSLYPFDPLLSRTLHLSGSRHLHENPLHARTPGTRALLFIREKKETVECKWEDIDELNNDMNKAEERRNR